MKTNKIILPTKYYSLNKQLNPGIQIQNFFRVDHNSKFQQNPLKINNKKVEGLGKLVGGDFDLNFLTEEISAYEQTFVLTSYD